jgi:hypothetical protein
MFGSGIERGEFSEVIIRPVAVVVDDILVCPWMTSWECQIGGLGYALRVQYLSVSSMSLPACLLCVQLGVSLFAA